MQSHAGNCVCRGYGDRPSPIERCGKAHRYRVQCFQNRRNVWAINVRFGDEIDNGSLVFSLDKLGEDGYMGCNTKIDAEKGRIEYAWNKREGDYGAGVGLVNDNAWIAEVSAGTESANLTFLKNRQFVGAKRISVADAEAIMETGHERLFSELLAVISGQAGPLLTLDELKNSY